MNIGSIIAIYFVVWWITLFVVLPFGVKNAHEARVPLEEGHEPGAPVSHGLMKKALVNTAVAAAVTALIWWLITSGALA